MRLLSAAISIVLLLTARCLAAQAKVSSTLGPPACVAGELTLSFDGEGGNYNGMMHSGSLLVLRNIGDHVCTVPLKPQLRFADAGGRPVALHFTVPRFMHPGPVMVPVAVPPGAEATGDMRWVSGDAYNANNCVAIARASLVLADGTVTGNLDAHVCAAAGSAPEYEQQPLHRDAAYTSASVTR